MLPRLMLLGPISCCSMSLVSPFAVVRHRLVLVAPFSLKAMVRVAIITAILREHLEHLLPLLSVIL